MVLEGVGFSNGAIIVDEPEAVYYSGQVISGNVHFELDKPLSFTAINITFLGEAIVHWREDQKEMYNGVTQYREVNYEGRELYFDFTQCLCGGAGLSTLQAGLHSMPFTFQVPFKVPSSYKKEKGEIMYSMTASVDHLLPEKQQKIVKQFKVVAPLYHQANLKPIELAPEEVYACSCFCASTPVSVKVKLSSNTFNLGGTIPVTVQGKTQSMAEIVDIVFQVTTKSVYRTQQPASTSITPEEVLVEERSGALGDVTQLTTDLRLPEVLLPNLRNCTVMDVLYYLKVKIQLNGCNDDIDDEAEIFIGLLPGDEEGKLSGTLAQHLPNAPVPRPNQLEASQGFPAFKVPISTPYPNGTPKYPSNEMIPTNFSPGLGAALNNSHPAVSSPNLNYPGNSLHTSHIGFRLPNPYPSNAMPMPALPNTGTTYPEQSFSFDSTQPRFVVTPSAPPL